MVLPPRRAYAAIALAGVLLPAVLAGCGSSDKGDDGAGSGKEPALGKIPTMTDTASAAFPLDTYDLTNDEHRKLGLAQNTLTEKCMKRYGFDYRAPDPLGSPATIAPNSRIFGLTNADEAARYGYGDPTTIRPPAKPTGTPLDQVGQTVLSGTDDEASGREVPMSLAELRKAPPSKFKVDGKPIPRGGCSRESYLTLYAPKKESVDILFVFNLKAEAESRMRADSRVLAVSKKWSSCMKNSGYDVKDPRRATDELGLTEGQLSSAKAISAAKADVACKTKVNLVGVWFAVMSAYQNQAAEKYAETLDLFKKQQDERLRLSAQLA